VTPTTGIVYAGNMAPTTPIYVTTHQVTNYPAPLYSENSISSPAIGYYDTPAPPTVVQTEARKVVITQLPHSTSEAEFRDLLISKVSKFSKKGDYEPIETFEIAKHADGSPRGHAFAVFGTHSIAKSVIKSLDNHKFKGRSLRARLAKEGAEPTMLYTPRIETEMLSLSLESQCQPLSSSMSSSATKRSSKTSKSKDDSSEHTHRTNRHESKSSGRKPKKESSQDKKGKNREHLPEYAPLHEASDTPPVADGSSFGEKRRK
jgi:RNA recognition motif-containing protein